MSIDTDVHYFPFEFHLVFTSVSVWFSFLPFGFHVPSCFFSCLLLPCDLHLTFIIFYPVDFLILVSSDLRRHFGAFFSPGRGASNCRVRSSARTTEGDVRCRADWEEAKTPICFKTSFTFICLLVLRGIYYFPPYLPSA